MAISASSGSTIVDIRFRIISVSHFHSVPYAFPIPGNSCLGAETDTRLLQLLLHLLCISVRLMGWILRRELQISRHLTQRTALHRLHIQNPHPRKARASKVEDACYNLHPILIRPSGIAFLGTVGMGICTNTGQLISMSGSAGCVLG